MALLLPNLSGGGAERVAVNLLNAFVQRGVSCQLVLLQDTGVLRSDLHDQIGVCSLNVSRFRELLIPLMGYLKTNRPDTLLVFMWPLTSIAVVARAFTQTKTRLVLAEHQTLSVSEVAQTFLQRLILKAAIRLTFPWADVVTAVSRGTAVDVERLANLPPDSVKVIYNPIVGAAGTTDSRGPVVDLKWWHGDHRRILTVGTLKLQKDQATLLRAFAIVKQQVSARLLILGEGGERANLERMAAELGISEAVEMPGFVSNPRAYFERADLFVLSSRWEGFGNVLVESLDAGTPIVSTDCPDGPSEVLGEGCYGNLVPTGDSGALAASMVRSLQDTHDGARLRERAAHFSVSAAVDRYLPLLFPGWVGQRAE